MKQVTLEERVDAILAISETPEEYAKNLAFIVCAISKFDTKNDFSFKFEQVKPKRCHELNRIVIEW